MTGPRREQNPLAKLLTLPGVSYCDSSNNLSMFRDDGNENSDPPF